jgi:hypothetical protein
MRPEGSERLIVRRVPVAEAFEMALDGRMTDAMSLLAIMQYRIRTFSGLSDSRMS